MFVPAHIHAICAGLAMQAQEATNSTQTIIFPRQASDDDQQTHKMYVHSHRSFEPGACCKSCCCPHVCWRRTGSSMQLALARAVSVPSCSRPKRSDCAGEQATREYDWSKAKVDPASHRFGLVDCKGQQNSVKQVSSSTAAAQPSSAVRRSQLQACMSLSCSTFGPKPVCAGPLLQILQPDLDEGVRQQPVVSQIYDRHKATLGDTLG
jgi:hypothetical protein